MALGIFGILFYGIAIASVLCIVGLFLIKDENIKKVIFYFLSVLGMIVAVMGAASQPSNLILKQVIIWVIGFLSVIGIVVHIKAKSKMQYNIAYALTIISVILGILITFSII